MKIFCLAILSLLLLNSCASLLPKPQAAPQRLIINIPHKLDTKFYKSTSSILQIALPEVAPQLNTYRIAVRNAGNSEGLFNHINYVENARWSSNLPQMLQTLWIQTFANTRMYSAVVSDVDSVKSDYVLTIQVHDFELEYFSVPIAHITLSLQLTYQNKIIYSGYLESAMEADANNIPKIMQAFDRAFSSITQQISYKILLPH